MSTSDLKTLRAKIRSLPRTPGIYFFKDRGGNVIYIGKARSLQDRVRSYSAQSPDPRVRTIVAETGDVDYILTGSEREASFLENNFIQQYQPKFNLRLKDDKSFPYLRFSVAEPFPEIGMTRRVEADGARYFGPFSPAHQARKTIHLVCRTFGIRSCREKVPGSRKRPCLEHDLHLCSAPCVGYIGEEEYRENVDNALLFLGGHVDRLLIVLRNRMTACAEKQEFEQAAHWRDFIRTLEQIRDKPKLISVQLDEADIFGHARSGDVSAFTVFLMRRGKVIESESFLVRTAGEEAPEAVLSERLRFFYAERIDIPAKILLPFQPLRASELADFLLEKAEKKVKLIVPRRGKARKLVELAASNASALLRENEASEDPGALLQKLLDLPSPPLRIEGYDISNTGGEESVGSLVVFVNGEPVKSEYRMYGVRSVSGPNDTASLEEVVGRRLNKLRAEGARLPDLILVDGGKGQLGAALKALRAGGPDTDVLPVVSLAKREERIFSEAHPDGLLLDRASPDLLLLQRIRDEAHRFALTFHRKRREKKSFASVLDDIPGLGKIRKQRLQHRFPGLDDLRSASLQELTELVGAKAAGEIKKRIAGLG